jgi:hypothetical protein
MVVDATIIDAQLQFTSSCPVTMKIGQPEGWPKYYA